MKKAVRVIKHIPRKVLACSLLLTVISSLYGCGGKIMKTVQEGIVISPDPVVEYSEETEGYAEYVIFDLLQSYYRQTVIENLPVATLNKLELEARQIGEITRGTGLSEEKYIQFIEALDEHGDAVISDLVTEGESPIMAIKPLYLELSELLGVDYISRFFYCLCLHHYDRNYRQQIENYERYGYSYLLEDAQRYRLSKEILISEVGEDNFATVLRMGFMLSDVFFGGALEGERIQSFSNREILLFLQHMDISKLSVSARGWELLLSFFVPERAGTDFSSRFLYTANENGDLKRLSEMMSSVVPLLASAQASLAETDIDLFRDEDHKALLQSVFRRFGDAEWAHLELIASVSFETASYELIAVDCYGEDYQNYAAGIEAVSLEQLKIHVTDESFFDMLERCIAGVSPAFSYTMLHAQEIVS